VGLVEGRREHQPHPEDTGLPQLGKLAASQLFAAGELSLSVTAGACGLGFVDQGEPGPDREDHAEHERAGGLQWMMPARSGDVAGMKLGSDLAGLARSITS
jgi:hypothetical protein